MRSSYFKISSIFIICGLGTLVYSNSFFCSFHFDDISYITSNYAIRNVLNLQDIWNYWPCRFITFLTFAVNYHFGQLNVLGYHIFNLVIHLISACLVWWLTLLIFTCPIMKEERISRHADLLALLTGMVFVTHPIQTEAVTFIYQRAASIATMFYLASLCFYIKSRLLQDKRSNAGPIILYYICSLIMALAAMYAKEITITLPLMILLIEFSFFKSKMKFNWACFAPFLIIVMFLALTMILTETGKTRLELRGEPGISSFHYLLTQFRVIATYLRLVFLPLNQNLDYDYSISKSIFELPVIVSLLLIASILFWTGKLFSKYRILTFSILWFFIALLPESSLLPIKDVIFEHRLYLPLMGFSLFLVSGMYYFWGEKAIKTTVVVLLVMITFNSYLTYQRNKIWKDQFSLWDDTVQKSPNKARPYNNRGNAYFYLGDFTQAVVDYDKAIELDPNKAEYYYNRGVIFDKENRFDPAIADYNKAIELDQNLEKVYNNLGIIYAKRSDLPQAISNFNKTIGLDPKDQDAYNNRGNVLTKQGNFSQAIDDYAKAIELNPNYTQAYYNRAVNYYQLKEYDNAWRDVHQAKELGYPLNPKFIDLLKASSGQDQ